MAGDRQTWDGDSAGVDCDNIGQAVQAAVTRWRTPGCRPGETRQLCQDVTLEPGPEE